VTSVGRVSGSVVDMPGTVAAAIIPHPVPIYEYKCDNGHVFDVIQKMVDEPLTECQECGAPAVRVLHSPAVHFKGSGFYNTDYGKKKKGGGAAAEGSSSGGEGSSEGGSSGTNSNGDSSPKPSESKSSDSKPKAATAD
jgi:putative FmdB family regulatory protein